MSIRGRFEKDFSADLAQKLYDAAVEHHPDDRKGSDPFKWALSICIGFECFLKDSYREYHKIDTPAADISQWIIKHADLASHDGDFDALAAFCGKYDGFLAAETK